VTDRELLLAFRQALLLIVDAIERRLGLPRTSDMRRAIREALPEETPSCIQGEMDV
jgi:hypothetical protein